jgi:5-methylcytosine-specific restriction endonuclease McrA
MSFYNNTKGSRYREWRLKCKEAKCAKCGRSELITIDHIVPITILEQFCMDKRFALYEFDENFQFLCRYCNYIKGGRMDITNPRTIEILEKVIAIAKRNLGYGDRQTIPTEVQRTEAQTDKGECAG